jgi:hypothetical protein
LGEFQKTLNQFNSDFPNGINQTKLEELRAEIEAAQLTSGIYGGQFDDAWVTNITKRGHKLMREVLTNHLQNQASAESSQATQTRYSRKRERVSDSDSDIDNSDDSDPQSPRRSHKQPATSHESKKIKSECNAQFGLENPSSAPKVLVALDDSKDQGSTKPKPGSTNYISYDKFGRCTGCGAKTGHKNGDGGACLKDMNPYFNPNKAISWKDSKEGKAYMQRFHDHFDCIESRRDKNIRLGLPPPSQFDYRKPKPKSGTPYPTPENHDKGTKNPQTAGADASNSRASCFPTPTDASS